jgi:hypothetical protein
VNRRVADGSLQRMRSLLPAVAGALLMASCAFVDGAIEPRSDTMNRSLTDYRNAATLLNILRASENEPMNFVVVTGATGHNTLGGSQGIPTWIVGPHTVATATTAVVARNYSFGPNSVNESFANDFNISSLDDPQSYAALMTPLDPGKLGFFFGLHWPAEVLLPLSVSEIRMIPLSGAGVGNAYVFYTEQPIEAQYYLFCSPGKGSTYADSYATDCEPHKYPVPSSNEAENQTQAAHLEECRQRRAFCVLSTTIVFTYLRETGLTIQIPAGSVPGTTGQQQTPARICFDEVYSNFSVKDTLSQALQKLFFADHPSRLQALEVNQHASNSGIEFLESISDVPGSSSLRHTQPLSRHSRCDDPNTPWIKAAAAQVDDVAAPAAGKPPAAAKAKVGNPQNSNPAFEFYDRRTDAIFQIFTRSTWGIYQFLGRTVKREEQSGLPFSVLVRGYERDHELFHVDHNVGNCFTAVIYSEAYHCVPKQRSNTKQTLSLLHELVNLYTKPNSSQQPNTGTTRITN